MTSNGLKGSPIVLDLSSSGGGQLQIGNNTNDNKIFLEGFSGDGNGKIYKLDMAGNLVGWAQTSKGHGQTGCLIHELHCESDTVVYKGDCSTWTVEKITITGAGRAASTN